MIKELTKSRDEELRSRFYNLLNSGVNRRYCKWSTFIKVLAKQPAPCFYITPKMAEQYILNYYRGEFLVTNPQRLQMVRDLVECYEKLKMENPDMRQYELWNRVVEMPAKSFYLSEITIRDIVYEYKRTNGHHRGRTGRV